TVQEGRYTTQTATALPFKPQSGSPPHSALAAVIAASLERPVSDDPWQHIGPFRMSGSAELAFHSEALDWEAVIATQRGSDPNTWWVEFEGNRTTLSWWKHRDGRWTVRVGDTVTHAAISRRDDDSFEVTTAEGRWMVRQGRRPAE